MKKTKIALTLVCAILLVAASVMGTLAYLTSTTDEVKNTFTVGDNVAISLDEAKVGTDGKKITGDGATRVTSNSYKLFPGHVYDKDPTVHVTGSDCYVFIEIANIIDADLLSSTAIETQMAANGWKSVAGYTGVYVYATGDDTKTAVAQTVTTNPETGAETKAPKDLLIFDGFTIKDSVGHDDLKDLNNTSLTITAYAIQKDGFESTTPADIWKDNFYVAPATPEGDA